MTEAHATQPVTTPAAPAVATPAHPAHPHGHAHGHTAHTPHAAHPHPAHHAAEAARAPVQAPESKDAQPAATDATTAVIPPQPEVKIPTPVATHAAGHGHRHAANDPHAKRDLEIEGHLSKFFGARLTPDLLDGLSITVISDHSNRVTGGAHREGSMDVKLVFTGNALANQESANKLRDGVVKALLQHPSFAGYQLKGTQDPVTGKTFTLQLDNLSKERFAELLKEHSSNAPQAPATTMCTHGAGCLHCTAPTTAANVAAVSADVAAEPATATADAAATTAIVEQPKGEAKPEVKAVAPDVTQVVPTTTVGTPGELQGQIAANNEKMQERA